MRVDNIMSSDFGDQEIRAVQYAVFDVLGNGTNSSGLIELRTDVTSVFAVDVASIDLSFAVETKSPSDKADSPEDLLSLVNVALKESVASGYLSERLLYWAGHFTADSQISNVNTNATEKNLDEADVPNNFFFTKPTVPADQDPPSTNKKSKKKKDDSATTAAITVPIVLIVVAMAICLYLYFSKMCCFAEDNTTPLKAGDADRDAPVEQVGQTEIQEVAVDEADMSGAAEDSLGTQDLSVVDPPSSGASDVQEKIIEADL